MNREEALQAFKDRNALLEGHFLLTSGKHSPRYLQCALVCQHPDLCERMCQALAERLQGVSADVVVGPAMGGIVLAYELARALGVRGVFMERDDAGRMQLRRGFKIASGEKVIVAEDVMTTGGSVAEIVKGLREQGAETVAVACLVDRGGLQRFDSVKKVSLLEMDIPVYDPADCPLCSDGAELVKPGSRKLPGGKA